ncbi:MAG TPA: alpha/beta hydrolase, partial [Candidatus Binatia bacterium]|nr:alpha/beta hydrolase [Candidatus Binatia bacterium]
EPLLLVHGIGADKDNFSPIAPYLRGLGRVIVPDLPGFGESSKPSDGDYSIETQADRLRELVDGLGLPAVHLGGSSMGGAIVLAFALRHPERVRSLWLLAPAGVAAAAESEMFRRHRERGEFALFARTPAEYAEVMRICFTRPPFVPHSVRRRLAGEAMRNWSLHTRIFGDLLAGASAIEEAVAGLAIPALIVWGEADRVLDVSGAEILHRALPQSRLVRMPDIGHLPMIEAPRRVAADYRAFRASLAEAGKGASGTWQGSSSGSSDSDGWAGTSRSTRSSRTSAS